jgi:murein DD-endopeptidase MepM/ murein hydrolase activator NlpD
MRTASTNIVNLLGRVSRKNSFRMTVLATLAIFCVMQGFKLIDTKGRDSQSEAAGLLEQAISPVSSGDNLYRTNTKTYDEIRSGESLYAALRRLNVQGYIAERYIKTISEHANLRNIRAGDRVMVERRSMDVQLGNISLRDNRGEIIPQGLELFLRDEKGLAFKVRAELLTQIEDDPKIQVKIERPTVAKELSLLSGEVSGSLYASVVAIGGDAQLVNSFSDIFNWQIDFFRESQIGDRFQIVAERNFSEGRFIGFGAVQAAQYVRGNKILRGYYFSSKDGGVSGFFDEKGMSLKSAFLKSPLKLATITSKFNQNRFHPVQKRYKPHNGVDYGANRGTPFMAVASGTVINAGFSPFNGNYVKLRHMNGYETEYLHATKLAKGIRVGARVDQGQVIGYVGKTGLASGYHLHFGMKNNGKYVDPIKQKFNNSPGIPSKYLREFQDVVSPLAIAFNMQLSPKDGKVAEVSRIN